MTNIVEDLGLNVSYISAYSVRVRQMQMEVEPLSLIFAGDLLLRRSRMLPVNDDFGVDCIVMSLLDVEWNI